MKKKVVILGGGISGLTAAYFLHKEGFDVTVLEKDKEAGGVIKSTLKEGFLCEQGPNTVLINNEGISELLGSLKLIDSIVSPDVAASKNRFILKNNTITAVPTSPIQFISTPLLKPLEKLRLLKEPFLSKYKGGDQSSLKDFVTYRFGSAFYDNFIVPFVTGIYAGDPSQMSAKYTLSMLYEAEQKHGSVFKGFFKRMKAQRQIAAEKKLPKQKMFSFHNGLQHLPKAIEQSIGKCFTTAACVTSIAIENGHYHISYNKDNEQHNIQADVIINTLPAFTTAALFAKINPTISAILNNVNYVPITVFHFGFKKKSVINQTAGFGILPLPNEKKSFLGILFNSRIFPHTAPEDADLFTVITGGSRSPELTQLPVDQLEELVLKELCELLQISDQPIFKNVVAMKKAIPQYSIDHETLIKEVKKIEDKHNGLYLSGNYVHGVSVSDCIHNSYQIAKKIAGSKK